jgi:hypothetical protein
MIPRGAEGINHLAERMVADLIPKAPDAYTMADIGLTAALVRMVAQDYDRAADTLVTEMGEMRDIFEYVLPHLTDAAFRARLEALVDAGDGSLRIAALSERHDAMMRVLIEMQAGAEDGEAAGVAWAGPLNGRIWTFLEGYVARRAYDAAL